MRLRGDCCNEHLVRHHAAAPLVRLALLPPDARAGGTRPDPSDLVVAAALPFPRLLLSDGRLEVDVRPEIVAARDVAPLAAHGGGGAQVDQRDLAEDQLEQVVVAEHLRTRCRRMSSWQLLLAVRRCSKAASASIIEHNV